MATDLERLVVSLEANVKKYESALSKAQRDSDKAAKKIEKSFNSINPAFALLNKGLAGLAAGVTGGAIFGAVKEAIDDLGKIADLADRAQVSTDFIQALGHSVTLAGGSMEDAARAATKFGKELGDMNDKNNELRRIFEANHVSITDQNGALRDSADLFGEFAKLIANAKNPQEAMNLAAKAFGEKVGPKLLTTLMEIGQTGMPAFIKKAKELGVVLDENLVRKGDDIGDRFQTLMTQLTRSFQKFVLDSVAEAEKIRAILKWLATHDAMGNEIIPLTPVQEMEAEVARLTQRIAEAAEANKNLDQSGGLFSLGGEHQDIEKLNEQLSVAVRNLNALRGLTGLPGAGNQPGATTTKTTVTNLPGPKTTDQFAQDIANFNKRIAVERVELELIDATTFAREKGKVAAELLAEAEKANAQAGLKNTEASIAQKAIIEKLSTEWAQLAADMERAKLPLREFVRDSNNLPKNLNEIALHGLKGFEDALIDLAQGATTAKEAFNKMAKSIIEDITRMVIKMQITAPIALAFSQLINSITSGGFNLSGARYTTPPGIGSDILRNNITSPRTGAESSLGLRIDVKNYGTSQQEFAMRRDANGTHVLEVLIDRAVGRSINTPGTSGDRAMVSRGINFPLQRRA